MDVQRLEVFGSVNIEMTPRQIHFHPLKLDEISERGIW